MRVCIDTNVLVRLFGSQAPFAEIKSALLAGRLELAVSTEIMLEYEEVITRLSSAARWKQLADWLGLLSALHGNVISIEPQYRFQVIVRDPHDNKFSDGAITAEADYVVTEDTAFSALRNAGYKPQPISPRELITLPLTRMA